MEQKKQAAYTYSDYEKWDDGNRWELIDGTPHLMSPGPSVGHQRIVRELGRQIANHLRGKACEVFLAPFDVLLNADAKDDTVVQPDLLVVCDPKKLANGRHCVGAPDMVVEVLSPSTANRDRIVKFNRYRAAGIREYWIVDPEYASLSVHLLRDGGYVSEAYGDAGQVPVDVLDGCVVDLAEVFRTARPRAAAEEAAAPPPKTERGE